MFAGNRKIVYKYYSRSRGAGSKNRGVKRGMGCLRTISVKEPRVILSVVVHLANSYVRVGKDIIIRTDTKLSRSWWLAMGDNIEWSLHQCNKTEERNEKVIHREKIQ